jgi:hypothetical protein
MKSWIKIGAICEVRGDSGALYRVDRVYKASGEVRVRRIDCDFTKWLAGSKDLMRTNKARQEEKTQKSQKLIQKSQDLAQARLLAERHGYAVVRKMP